MSDKLVTPLSDDESSWMWVWNGSEYELMEDYNAVAKAQSFNGDRGAAGRYAARIRWGNRGADVPPPNDGDPFFDATVVLTAEERNIAARAEAAVVSMQNIDGYNPANNEEQIVEEMVAAGFVGNGPLPTGLKYTTEDDIYRRTKEQNDLIGPSKDDKIYEELGQLNEEGYQSVQLKIAEPFPRQYPTYENSDTTQDRNKPNRFITRESEITEEQYGTTKITVKHSELFGKQTIITYYPTKAQVAVERQRLIELQDKQSSHRQKLSQYYDWLGVPSAPEGENPISWREKRASAIIAPKLAEHHGFSKGAQPVTAAQFDALAKSGKFIVVHRASTKENIASLSTTKPSLGRGKQGVGTYTAYSSERAGEYLGGYQRSFGAEATQTPMLIPKTALRVNRTRTGIHDLGNQFDVSGYVLRANMAHGDSDERNSFDFIVHNVSMLIVGPNNHSPKYFSATTTNGAYTDWVETQVRKLINEQR